MSIRFVFVFVFVLFCVMGVVYGGSNTTNINNTSDISVNDSANDIILLENHVTGWNVWLLTCVIIMVLIIFIIDRRQR